MALRGLAGVAFVHTTGDFITNVRIPFAGCLRLFAYDLFSILYRRAVRLRRLTGDSKLKTQGEIDGANMTMSDIAQMTLVRPFILGFREPIVFAFNIYVALAYG